MAITRCKICKEAIAFQLEDMKNGELPGIILKSISMAVKDRNFDVCDDCKLEQGQPNKMECSTLYDPNDIRIDGISDREKYHDEIRDDERERANFEEIEGDEEAELNREWL